MKKKSNQIKSKGSHLRIIIELQTSARTARMRTAQMQQGDSVAPVANWPWLLSRLSFLQSKRACRPRKRKPCVCFRKTLKPKWASCAGDPYSTVCLAVMRYSDPGPINVFPLLNWIRNPKLHNWSSTSVSCKDAVDACFLNSFKLAMWVKYCLRWFLW